MIEAVRTVVAVVIAALTAATASASRPPSAPASGPNRPGGAGHKVPARDIFDAAIVQATGRFAGAHGTVTVVLRLSSPAPVRRMTMTFRRAGCTNRCLQLTGVLRGTLRAAAAHVPADAGRSYAVTVSGELSPLGHVTATGTIRGTGFIRFGAEALALRVLARRGTVKIGGHSRRVPGFTSP